jgi:pimeloyl-ACP methyl ester carboxylesterase
MDSIEVRGLRITYERAGSGPPLLLLHGYVGDAASTWHAQLNGLSDAFTVVAWNAPGAGGSTDPPETIGMAGYADCLADFVDSLGLERPHVAGLSFGGALALALVDRHPQLPTSLVLASAYAGWGGSLTPEATDQRLRQALTLSRLSGEELVEALLPTMFHKPPTPTVIAAFERSLRAFSPSGLRAMARAAAEDLRDALPRVQQPTLLVYGDEDVRAPLSVAHAIRDRIARSQLTVLAGAGHVCNIEEPEAFNSRVRGFLLGLTNAAL